MEQVGLHMQRHCCDSRSNGCVSGHVKDNEIKIPIAFFLIALYRDHVSAHTSQGEA
jgi:hypothetical protein